MSKQFIVSVITLLAVGVAVFTAFNNKLSRQADDIVSDVGTSETPSYFEDSRSVRDGAFGGERGYREPQNGADGEIEYEVVHGLRVRKDRNCTVTAHYIPNGDGTVTAAYSCEPNVAGDQNPYDGYSDETLAEMAYHDAIAAETLGMRLRNEDQELAMSLVIRASALAGGDARPILEFSNAYPAAARIDGQSVAKTLQVQYVLSAVVEILGAENHGRQFWESRVRTSVEEPDAAIEQFNEEALKIIAEMQAIQREVTGVTTIRRGGENA